VIRLSILTAAFAFSVSWCGGSDAVRFDARDEVTRLVQRIQRADYEGDRATLQRFYDELASFEHERDLTSRVLYWRGFAMWRRAFNGFNQSATPKELEADLQRALERFAEAIRRDPAFVDANVGAISCLQSLLYLNRDNDARIKELVPRLVQLFKESLDAAPDNPRLLWVRGAQQWYNPPERGGGQEIAMATYERGLELARKQKGKVTDPLEPTWGEPELLMSLAWTNLNKSTPNVDAAEQYAKSALAIVPHWHYLRDILMPQIANQKSRIKNQE